MCNPTKFATAPGGGTQGRPAGLGTWALAILAAAWAGASGAAWADTFVLKSSELVEGAIVQATRNTLIIRRSIGGMHQMSIYGIEEVRIDLAQGQQISGQLLGWADGVCRIRSGGEMVRIGEGRILSRGPLEAEPERTQPPRPREAEPARTSPPQRRETPKVETATAPAAPAASAAREIGAKGVAANGRHAAMPTAEVAAAPERESRTRALKASLDPAERPTAGIVAAPESDRKIVALKASVVPGEEGAAGVVFTIELSRPAEQTIVLIYGTVDGTARGGTDYEPQQGVITLAPGTTSTQVRVPLIDHQRPRDDARFELFLTADPKVVAIAEPRITATIPVAH